MKTTYTRNADQIVKGKETILFTNKRSAKIQIDLRRTTADENYKHGLMNLWVKAKKLPKFIKNRLTVETYATNEQGDCFGYYNPTIKKSDDGKRLVINFDWVLEDTETNRQKIIDEVIRLANADEWTDSIRHATK